MCMCSIKLFTDDENILTSIHANRLCYGVVHQHRPEWAGITVVEMDSELGCKVWYVAFGFLFNNKNSS